MPCGRDVTRVSLIFVTWVDNRVHGCQLGIHDVAYGIAPIDPRLHAFIRGSLRVGGDELREVRKWRERSQSATEDKTVCHNGFRLNFGRLSSENEPNPVVAFDQGFPGSLARMARALAWTIPRK